MTLQLYKQNFKFSAAHFLIFDQQHAEKLHGHNYRVRLALDFADDAGADKGFSVDFKLIKDLTLKTLMEWDEMVLLPALHPEMKITSLNEKTLQVHFRDRYYAFPKNEVVKLPINNTSVENLSQLLWTKLAEDFKKWGVRFFKISVEETLGQAGVTSRHL